MSGVFYGRETFDAQLIVAQMVCMQALHYLGLGAAFFLMDALMGVPLSLDQFFGARVRSHGAQIGTARARPWLRFLLKSMFVPAHTSMPLRDLANARITRRCLRTEWATGWHGRPFLAPSSAQS